jgi:hypothetical protein
MNTASLTFSASAWTIAASVIAVLLAAGLGFVAWRRSGYRRSILALELLRLAIVGLAAFLLNQPEWVEEFRPKEKPTIAVMWDESTSMGTRDVLDPDQPTQPPQTRQAAVAPFTSKSAWASLSERFDVVMLPFAGGANAAARTWPSRSRRRRRSSHG